MGLYGRWRLVQRFILWSDKSGKFTALKRYVGTKRGLGREAW